jgi:hypothetical protein
MKSLFFIIVLNIVLRCQYHIKIDKEIQKDSDFIQRKYDVPSQNKGLYVGWHSGEPEVRNLSYVSGGEQIMLEWYALNPEEVTFDFRILDSLLQNIYKKEFKTTIQANNNHMQSWIFDKTPYYPGRFSLQKSWHEKVSPMNWHPVYTKAYTDFSQVRATHLKNSAYRSAGLGIRQNFNALGTEFQIITEEYVSLEQWVIPSGVEPYVKYSDKLINYMKTVLNAYVKNYKADFLVFVLNNIPN